MRHLRIRALAVLFAAVLALPVVPGAAAPAEEMLYDFDGKAHTLEEYVGKGKWLVVTVWASDCAICNQEIPELIAFHDAHRNKGAEVLGISVDGPARKGEAQAFIERHRIRFPNLLDGGRAFKAIYLRDTGRPWFGGTPMNLIYAPDGSLAARRIGPLARAEIESFIEAERRN